MSTLLALLRHVFAIAALPFVMAVLIPIWIWRRYEGGPVSDLFALSILAKVAGLCFLLTGLFLFVHSLRRFATDGKGTLAPWDPPRHLVIRGPYRFVRNPMISGVIFILIGEALVLFSPPHALWALTFFAINAVYIPLLEEPQLRHRFGAEYIEYCKHVPRLVPRLRPWQPVPLKSLQ
jgi:protein-S-isoprenylcysteine O-methyltransferase Ste14